MAYAAVQDLITRYGQQELIELSDRADPPTGTVDAAVAGQALADAGDMIDTYLAVQYALPIGAAPPSVVDAACTIARYKLHRVAPTEKVRQDYEDVLKWLALVSKGTVRLPGVTGPEPAGRTGTVLMQLPDRQFTRKTMRGL
ncbi:MAG: hypothetical protein JWP35_3539 [Caulobacter sp.]|nr:hypothetical protein [Caulobacter sp.]